MTDEHACCGSHDHHSHAHDGDGHHDSEAGRHVCHHGPLDAHRGQTDVICLEQVSFNYGEVRALHHVTLHIEAGCNLGIIGPNGGGKSTLLKIILGLLTPTTGSVSVLGRNPREVCRRGDMVGYVPQKHEFEPRFPLSVRQVVRMGLVGRTGLMRRYAHEDLEHVERLLERVGIMELADRPIGELSGGQQQRTFIARALAPRPRILLLDEPTVGVDVAGQRKFAELIHQLHDALELTIVVVSHDLRTIAASSGKIAILKNTIHYHDSPAGLTPQLIQEVFQHDIAPILSGS